MQNQSDARSAHLENRSAPTATPAALLKTPLYERHLTLGARMVDFGGWNLPVQYAGILEEHKAVRERAGVFDVSHMGEIEVSGPAARAFLDYLLTANLTRLTPQRAVYSPMCLESGGTVDDLIVYQQSAEAYLLVVNAANTDKDVDWITRQAAPYEVRVRNRSGEFAQIALQGPASAGLLAAMPELAPAAGLRFFQFTWLGAVADRPLMVSRTGYTGEDGFEIYCPPADAVGLFDRLIAAGAMPCGLGARDSLRFEAALPLFGHELEADISPREAGLDRFVDLQKSAFIGRDALSRPPARRIIGLRLEGRAIPRAGYPVLYQGRPVGTVTSGMFAPTLGHGCAMALVDADVAELDSPASAAATDEPFSAPSPSPAAGSGFAIAIRGREEAADRVGLPFYRRPR